MLLALLFIAIQWALIGAAFKYARGLVTMVLLVSALGSSVVGLALIPVNVATQYPQIIKNYTSGNTFTTEVISAHNVTSSAPLYIVGLLVYVGWANSIITFALVILSIYLLFDTRGDKKRKKAND